jgi:hypothetical protein
MTRARALALTVAATLAACTPAVVRAEGWCPPDTVPSTTTATTTTTEVTSTTDPAGTTTTTTTVPPTTTTVIVGPADPIEPPRPVDWCVDTNGDGIGAYALSVGVCFTDPAVELWVTVVWQIVNTYNVSVATANAMLISLLTS